MFTDMVGFTPLNQSNEAQALEVLERHDRLLRPFFPKFNGREVKNIWDSFLVEFDNAAWMP
jgi:adenylate cyclase